MSEFIQLEENAPATLGAVVEVVTRLSTYSEAQILELVSAGKIKEVFPFQPIRIDELPADTVGESELVEASALPLSREQRALIHSSMPSKAARLVKNRAPRVSRASKKAYSQD